ncbi:hypothetical protein [Syntrophus aciditrophicus]|uniref:Hypothetical cytosolic protein n=1 Tax=Syntrophus aciditrophicus (strain SB) TaxID=56780 RepID=Q2LPI8_SYNAS|nr:hypothetical protein [Syntrophus aciditrophicus]ABC76365.1 hypothetical cytosolic protein [Syntrophus aciditrophicus SB]OPY14976.1 MAG: hypothetical protein A4E74_02280 [Syntrophus sp. PtaB.Bin075]
MGASKEDINKMLNEKAGRMQDVLDLLKKSRERLNEEGDMYLIKQELKLQLKFCAAEMQKVMWEYRDVLDLL